MGLAHFFSPRTRHGRSQEHIQQQLSELDSELDLVAVEQPGNETLRLFIDHPGGVDLGLCERVTKHLGEPARRVLARGLLAGAQVQPTQVNSDQTEEKP